MMFYLCFFFLLLFPLPAAAYLDPGTGSILAQSLLAALAAVSGMLWLYWRKTKSFFLRLFGKRSRAESNRKKRFSVNEAGE